MSLGRVLMSRTFVFLVIALAGAVGSLAAPLWRGDATVPRGLPPSQRLTDAYLTLLCRAPSNAETLRWDIKPFTVSELETSVRATAEGVRVRAVRRLYLDVLLRDPFDGDCEELRQWIDRQTPVFAIARRLAASREARRVGEVRDLLSRVRRREIGGWDNASVRRWAQTGLTPSEISARLANMRPLVGVYYFAWYRQDSGGWGNGATTVPGDTPRPTLGWYTSSDETVMDAHIGQLVTAGFDFVILQVIAESPESWATAHRFMGRLAGTRLKAVVMLDGLYTTPISGSAAAVERAKTEFGGNPHYFWSDGRPLFLLFSGRLDFPVPGVTVRNVYWADQYGPGANTFNSDRLLLPHDWPFWTPTPPPMINGIVPVVPGYSDTHLGREEAMEHPRRDGQMYHAQWQAALALRPEFVIVYSWNEHFERTAIEPTEAWGESYLQWTACYVALAHAGREGSC